MGLGTLVIPQPIEAPPTSYAGSSVAAGAIFVVAGLGLSLVGLVASLTGRSSRIGDLALLAGMLWFSPAWVGWHDGPPVVISLAMVAGTFTFPVVVHLVLAFPSGKVQGPVAAALVGALYVESTVVAVLLALLRDPFFDPRCWANCTENVFLVRSMPRLASVAQVADRWLVTAAAASLLAVCVWRLMTASSPGRRGLMPVAGPGMLMAAATASHGIALQFLPTETVSEPALRAIFFAWCSSAILLAIGLLFAQLRTRAQRRAVARIGSSLGDMPAPGSVESALRRAVGDPDLRIAYWLPESERYVDATGHPMPEPAATPGRTLTALVRDGRRVALVVHTATHPELEREIGAALRLGVENERLQAEVLARLDELRASRARIVETADAERRRMERDLHDGAQQQLLALSYDLRLAHAQAAKHGNVLTASLLSTGVTEAREALGELRGLAHGIYPAVLTEAGLVPALQTYADEASVPVEIGVESELGRCPSAIETAAYLVVTEAVEDSVGRGAGYAAVTAVREDGWLVITVDDDGSDRRSPMLQVADRVGAAGGSLSVEATRVRAEFPCA